MIDWDDDLRVAGTGLFLDSRRPRPLCFVSHAHSDHIPQGGGHTLAIATAPTAELAEYRIGASDVVRLGYRTDHAVDPDTRVRLLPAGHVFGSAMIHVARPGGTLLYTGDFKLRPSLTVEPADPEPADALVMESTYGLPMFRFPDWRQTHARLVDLAAAALKAGRQPIVMGYSLGKAQEAVRVLTDAGLPVTCHGAVFAMNGIHERLGVPLGPYRKYAYGDFHGPAALDLAERGVLVAPPQVARSGFVTRFDDPLRVMLSGWGLLKNAQYRYGVDEVLPLSDHADFGELLELIDRVRPKRVYTHHGYREFVDHLRKRGIDATLARPDAQLSLFE
ncbi:MAG TPA: MBL fold metallo-hydrolase RNA specificity domain-containing protein [Humisphaera sp.]